MFIKRAKSRPSLRARETEGDEVSTGSPLKNVIVAADQGGPSDGASGVEEEEYSGGSVMERKKAKNKEKKQKNSRLSFGLANESESVEGEEGVVKPRKSLLSQSIKLPSTPTTRSPLSSTLGGDGMGTTSSSIYSKEYLKELKANTPSKSIRTDEDAMGENMAIDPNISDKYAAMIKEDGTAGIPDQATILAARNKRLARVERAKRGEEMGQDYISLGEGQVAIWDDGQKGPHPESRLMREEDEGEDGDEAMADYTEANDRLYLGKQANKSAARRLKGEIGELIDDREAEEEDDEETREWEEAQVRRGGNWEPEKPVKETTTYTPAQIPVARPLPTIAGASARLAKALQQAQAIQSDAEKNLEIAVRDLGILEEQERDLRVEVERVEGKREWVEEFRGWVEMLGQFLEEKVPKLNSIETDGIQHMKERGEMANKRRRLDDEDDLSLFLGAPKPSSEEVDELGRSREMEAGPSSSVRKARRLDRHSRRTKRRSRSAKNEEEGYSTDSSLDDVDAEDYELARKDLRRRTRGLLDDVKAEDFKNPEKGLAVRFGDWRKRYEEEYVGAFGGLSMVQAWEFYARSEMIAWEPLRSSVTIDSFDWFHQLHAYSRPRSSQDVREDEDMDIDDEPPLGPDGDLVFEMVQKTVVPLLIKQFESGALDPYSTPQTRKSIDLIEVVGELMGKGHSKYVTLLRTILNVYNETITQSKDQIRDSTSIGAIRPPDFDPESRIALNRFTRKRLKLIKNVLLWKREVSAEVDQIVNRIVGEVLRPVLENQWDGGGKELAQEVLNVAHDRLRADLVHFLRNGPIRRAW